MHFKSSPTEVTWRRLWVPTSPLMCFFWSPYTGPVLLGQVWLHLRRVKLFSHFLSKDWHYLCLQSYPSLYWRGWPPVWSRAQVSLWPFIDEWCLCALVTRGEQATVSSAADKSAKCLIVHVNWQCVDIVNLLPCTFVLFPFRPEKAGPPLWSHTDCLQSAMRTSSPGLRMESSWSREATVNWWRRKGCTSSLLTCRYLLPRKCFCCVLLNIIFFTWLKHHTTNVILRIK